MDKLKGWHTVNRYFGESEGFTDYPREPGNYAIYVCSLVFGGQKQNAELMYIGTAINLKTRLSKHPVRQVLLALMDSSHYNYVYVKCCLISNERIRKERERKLIIALQPKVNCA